MAFAAGYLDTHFLQGCQSGSIEDLYRYNGIDTDSIIRAALDLVPLPQLIEPLGDGGGFGPRSRLELGQDVGHVHTCRPGPT